MSAGNRHVGAAAGPATVRVTEQGLTGLAALWRAGGDGLRIEAPFGLPLWLEAWVACCAKAGAPRVLAAWRGKRLLGVAPLMVAGRSARPIGSPDLCDYLDLLPAPGEEAAFFEALLAHLGRAGIRRLALGPLRADAPSARLLPEIALRAGWSAVVEDDERCYEMPLPASWEDYLAALGGKQRHEVRRKLRRLEQAGRWQFRTVSGGDGLEEHLGRFLALFRLSRADKADFLTADRLAFFGRVCRQAAREGLLRLFFLDIDGRPAAGALCFELAGTLYLYNSGYDPRHAALSAGQACILHSIRRGIENGLKRYSFLKGDEIYKRRLGGRPVPLVRLALAAGQPAGAEG